MIKNQNGCGNKEMHEVLSALWYECYLQYEYMEEFYGLLTMLGWNSASFILYTKAL